MRRRASLVAVCALAACFDPKLGADPFACGPRGACPPGYSCHDGMCRTPSPTPAIDAPIPVADASGADVPAGTADAPIPDAPIADARPADAPMSPPADARRRPDAPACVPIELLGNADFDSSSGPTDARKIAPWVASRANPPLVLNAGELHDLGVTPDTPTFAAALGGENQSEQTLYQIVVVPAGAAGLELTGKTWIVSLEPAATDFDVMTIDLLDAEGTVVERLATFTEADVSGDWRGLSAAAQSAHAGETVIFRLRAANGMKFATSFFVDSLSLRATCALMPR